MLELEAGPWWHHHDSPRRALWSHIRVWRSLREAPGLSHPGKAFPEGSGCRAVSLQRILHKSLLHRRCNSRCHNIGAARCLKSTSKTSTEEV